MAESEAACLLRTGALYVKRIGLRASGSLVFAGVKRGAFSLYFDDAPIFHFDLEGRWQRAFLDGVHYRKGLDNVVDALDRVRESGAMVIKRRTLGFAEVSDLDERIRQVGLQLREIVGTDGDECVAPPVGVEPLPSDDLTNLLDRIASWDAPAWFAHREKYVAAYGSESIFLPPDAQNSIVLQATAANGFFRTPVEFENHVNAVRELLGKRTIAASSVFLSDGSVLCRPLSDLMQFLETINRTFAFVDQKTPKRPKDRPFDAPELNGIELMSDADAGDRTAKPLDAPSWKLLANGRVRRVSIRLRYSTQDLDQMIAGARDGGVSVAILIEHGGVLDATLAALVERVNRSTAGSGDVVYLLVDGIVTEDELLATRTALKSLLEPVRNRGARVLVYNPDKQWS